MGSFYRSLFVGCLILPAFEIAMIPMRDPVVLDEPDAFMLLLVIASLAGLVLVDIREAIVNRSSAATRPLRSAQAD